MHAQVQPSSRPTRERKRQAIRRIRIGLYLLWGLGITSTLALHLPSGFAQTLENSMQIALDETSMSLCPITDDELSDPGD